MASNLRRRIFNAPETGKDTALFLGAISIAIVVYLLDQNFHRSFWFDEAATYAFSSMSWPEFFHAIHYSDAFYVAYYGFMHVWISVFGDSEIALRAPSSFSVLATIPVCYFFVKRLLGVPTAAISTLILASNAFFLRYGVEARVYAIGILLSILISWIFLDVVDNPRPINWARYALLSLIGVYSHFFMMFMLPAHFAYLIYIKRNRDAVVWLFISIGVLLAYAPIFYLGMHDVNSQNSWMHKTSARDLIDLIRAFWISRPLWMISAALLGASLVVGMRSQKRRQIAFLVLWAIVPTSLVLLIGHFRPIFTPPYLFEVFVPIVVMTAYAVSKLKTVIGSLVFAIIMSLQFYVLFHGKRDTDQDWRQATAIIDQDKQPHEVISYPSGSFSGYEYYNPKDENVIYPKSYQIAQYLQEAPVSSIRPSKNEVWIVFNSLYVNPTSGEGVSVLKSRMIAHGYQVASIINMDGLSLYRYVRR